MVCNNQLLSLGSTLGVRWLFIIYLRLPFNIFLPHFVYSFCRKSIITITNFFLIVIYATKTDRYSEQ